MTWKNWLRIALVVISSSGAAVIAAESRHGIDAHWEWAIPVCVAVGIVLMIDEVVHRVRDAITGAIRQRELEDAKESDTRKPS